MKNTRTRIPVNRNWSLIVDQPAEGSWNMARDEALLDQVSQGPVLRIYGWEDWTLSLGRFQDPAQGIQAQYWQDRPFPAVRRMTGGGAILHGQEITYSLVCTQEDLGTKDVRQSFRELCAFILRFYSDLGLNPLFAHQGGFDPASLGQKTAFCFAGKEQYDIVIQGRKIGGNAQRRFKDVIFQHGSIPIDLGWEGLMTVFPPQSLPGEKEISSIREETGEAKDWKTYSSMLSQAFEKTFEVKINDFQAFEELNEKTDELQHKVYSQSSWTMERQRRD